MLRKTNYQTLSWLNDLYKRGLLDLDPPYQRRSVWNQQYKDFFVDTVLNNYPCPAIFLYEQISLEGIASYKVVDGKQRLLTLFEFCNNEFPVYQDASLSSAREKNFSELDDELKLRTWRYQFAVEFIPAEDERLITEIFNRINRNVARLSRQELRHARFGGSFMNSVEALSEWTVKELPPNFPNIAQQSRKQMRDSEFVGTLLLYIEDGPRSFSQDQLDEAYSLRDLEWPSETETTERFKEIISYLATLTRVDTSGSLVRSRIRNQADFYALFGALHQLEKESWPDPASARERLLAFAELVDDDSRRSRSIEAEAYYAAARSASNDPGARLSRIGALQKVILGQFAVP
ncbi:GmrSD restriction endonuclease domain-containing protein [Belnapia rosea]|uniref:GmrSD restriction endonucleases N-terminal domain-containing protein n=1 Tax=Belnapia rosea TaxID=938405 RepID=A0A1G6KME0_9PROT|nr:DUF262 domain-containing protein [Belnapia rosea]SDC31695.1 Protein of unknown function DUF262 [Belnapia rosea]